MKSVPVSGSCDEPWAPFRPSCPFVTSCDTDAHDVTFGCCWSSLGTLPSPSSLLRLLVPDAEAVDIELPKFMVRGFALTDPCDADHIVDVFAVPESQMQRGGLEIVVIPIAAITNIASSDDVRDAELNRRRRRKRGGGIHEGCNLFVPSTTTMKCETTIFGCMEACQHRARDTFCERFGGGAISGENGFRLLLLLKG